MPRRAPRRGRRARRSAGRAPGGGGRHAHESSARRINGDRRARGAPARERTRGAPRGAGVAPRPPPTPPTPPRSPRDIAAREISPGPPRASGGGKRRFGPGLWSGNRRGGKSGDGASSTRTRERPRTNRADRVSAPVSARARGDASESARERGPRAPPPRVDRLTMAHALERKLCWKKSGGRSERSGPRSGHLAARQVMVFWARTLGRRFENPGLFFFSVRRRAGEPVRPGAGGTGPRRLANRGATAFPFPSRARATPRAGLGRPRAPRTTHRALVVPRER